MRFKKFEVLIRKNSKAFVDDVIDIFKNAINERQNKDPDTLWAAHLFDLRTLKEYMIFSDKSAKAFDIIDVYKTKKGESIAGVMKLGQKIMDINQAFKDEIQKNSNMILKIIEPEFFQLSQEIKNKISDFNNLEKSLDQLKKKNENFDEIIETLKSKIQDIEINISHINTKTEKRKIDSKENDNNAISGRVIEFQNRINNIEKSIDKLAEVLNVKISSNIDYKEFKRILYKIEKDEELSFKEKNELKEILEEPQGYII